MWGVVQRTGLGGGGRQVCSYVVSVVWEEVVCNMECSILPKWSTYKTSHEFVRWINA